MNVLLTLMAVILMQHATILKGVTPALATTDSYTGNGFTCIGKIILFSVICTYDIVS